MGNQVEGQMMIVQAEALSRALKLLAAANCRFAVIDAAGTKYGTLEVNEKVAGKRHYNHPPGTFLDHHKPFTAGLQAGGSVTVPYGAYSSSADRESLRSSISAFCSRTWGSKTCITAIADDGIQVLRVE